MKYFVIILSIYICVSCNQNERKGIIDYFPSPQEVTCKTIETDFFIGVPYQIDIINNLIIITDNIDEKLISIYDLKQSKTISQLFQKGNGPEDLIPPLFVKTLKEEDNISIFQRQTSIYKEYKLSDLCNGNKYTMNQIKFEENVDNIIKINNNCFLGAGLLKEGSIGIFNKDGKLIKAHNLYPSFINNLDNPSNKYLVGQQHFAYNKKLNKIMTASIFCGYIDFYDFKDNSFVKIKEYKPTISSVERNAMNGNDYKPQKNDLLYFDCVYSTDKHFYILYNGNPINKNTTSTGNFILQFDTEGNQKKCYKTDRKIFKFCVNENEDKIYAISLSDDLSYILSEIDI